MPYLFNRAVKLAPGNTLDSMAWAAKINDRVNAAGGPTFNLWTRVFGADIGTLSWSAVVNDLAELTTLEETLIGDAGYIELLEEGTRFGDGSGAHDSLGRLVHADPEGLATAQYATITTTQLAPGMMATGIALGVELAQRIKVITGRPTSFGASVTGPFGQVAFFILSDTIEQVQAANEALAADADWIATMDDRVSKAYLAGSAERMITRKLV